MKGNRQQPQCGFSAKTVSALDMLIPDYLHVNVLEHPEIRDGIKAYGNWPTIPQLYVAGELIGGSDIVLEMFESGELAAGARRRRLRTTVRRASRISGPAVAFMRGAVQQRPDDAVHLRIDASWQHRAQPGSCVTGRTCACTAVGLDLYMDPWTASRADGLQHRGRGHAAGHALQVRQPECAAARPADEREKPQGQARRGRAMELIDVRGPDERAIASIPGARRGKRRPTGTSIRCRRTR